MAAPREGWECVMTISAERLAGYAARLRETFPALAVEEIHLLGAGDNNDAVLVNGRMVFRFPRHAQAVKALATETALLRALAGRLPLAVPRPVYVADDVDGYERIPGEELARETVRALPAADQQAVAEQLAYIQSIPFSSTKRMRL